MVHEVVDGKRHVACVTRLPHLAVNLQGNREPVRIGDFIRRYEPRTERTGAIEALSPEPLAFPVLHIARAEVHEHGVPGDVSPGVALRNVTAAAADLCYAADMPPTLTHIALQVRNLDACVAFYGDFCGMAVVHRRGADRVVWLAEPGRETEFIIVLLSGGRGAGQASA